jgi:hypothetical protein
VVSLDDTVSSYLDLYEDGLADALADQPGIDAVDHVDREVVLVRSLLSLPDIQAAAIRALLAVNRNPRIPRHRPLPTAAMNALADAVATLMAGHGFAGRLRMGTAHDPSHFDLNDRHGPGFYRVFEQDRLVQVLGLRDSLGFHHDDGTIVNAYLRFTVEVVELAPGAAKHSEPDGCEVIAGGRVLYASYGQVPATIEGIEQILVSKASPLCESTASRAAIVDRWVKGLPWYVPDRISWEAADIAARWGFPAHARDLLRHTPGRIAKGNAVRER